MAVGTPYVILGGVQKAVPFADNPFPDEKNIALAFPLQLPFVAGTVTEIDLRKPLVEIGLFELQTVFIDNSQSGGQTSILFQGGGPRQTIVAAPYSQGYYRVMASPEMADIQCFNYAGATVNLYLINKALDGADIVWTTQPANGLQGTSFAASAQGANTGAGITATMPAIVNRTAMISGLSITGGGATAATEVDCTLTNIDSNGVAQTLHFEFAYPTGATVPGQPIVITFAPPLQVMPGQSAVLTMPGAAGNTNAAIALNGFYV